MTRRAIKVTHRAAREITRACEWWDANRPAAQGLLRSEIERVFELLAVQPDIGARAQNAKLTDVRRVHLSRVRYYLCYRARPDQGAVDILALWHTNRGTAPRV